MSPLSFLQTMIYPPLVSGTDWIKVKGILRKGNDSFGEFFYIEAMSIEKGAVGKDTVIN
jgi:hypothetical protein